MVPGFNYDYEHGEEFYRFSSNLYNFSKCLLADPKLAEGHADKLNDWLGKNLKKPSRPGDLDTLVWYRALEILHNSNRLN